MDKSEQDKQEGSESQGQGEVPPQAASTPAASGMSRAGISHDGHTLYFESPKKPVMLGGELGDKGLMQIYQWKLPKQIGASQRDNGERIARRPQP